MRGDDHQDESCDHHHDEDETAAGPHPIDYTIHNFHISLSVAGLVLVADSVRRALAHDEHKSEDQRKPQP